MSTVVNGLSFVGNHMGEVQLVSHSQVEQSTELEMITLDKLQFRLSFFVTCLKMVSVSDLLSTGT